MHSDQLSELLNMAKISLRTPLLLTLGVLTFLQGHSAIAETFKDLVDRMLSLKGPSVHRAEIISRGILPYTTDSGVEVGSLRKEFEGPANDEQVKNLSRLILGANEALLHSLLLHMELNGAPTIRVTSATQFAELEKIGGDWSSADDRHNSGYQRQFIANALIRRAQVFDDLEDDAYRIVRILEPEAIDQIDVDHKVFVISVGPSNRAPIQSLISVDLPPRTQALFKIHEAYKDFLLWNLHVLNHATPHHEGFKPSLMASVEKMRLLALSYIPATKSRLEGYEEKSNPQIDTKKYSWQSYYNELVTILGPPDGQTNPTLVPSIADEFTDGIAQLRRKSVPSTEHDSRAAARFTGALKALPKAYPDGQYPAQVLEALLDSLFM